jgi:hypothetical protein
LLIGCIIAAVRGGTAIKITQSPAIKTFASTAPLWQRT